MKRAVCWILIVALMLGFVSMIAFTAFAQEMPAERSAVSEPEQVEWVELGNLPDEIQPGPAQIPAIMAVDGHATVTGVRWVDEENNPVTTFAEGNIYYLQVTLAPVEGYVFLDWFDVYGYYSPSCEIISANEGVATYRYSTLPGVGTIVVTSSGVGEGLPFSGVTATVVGNATLYEVGVYDATADTMVENGNFEAGKNYQITYTLAPKPGYVFDSDLDVETHGNFGMGWNYDDDYLWLTEYFSTCAKVEKVEISITEPQVGMAIEDVEITLPTNALYTVEAYWIDNQTYETAEGTFQKGHQYQLELDLLPAEGYIFTYDTRVLINGEQTQRSGFDASGLYGWVYNDYSFLEKIAKVELPAMPVSIKMGDTLPADFKVADNANYTLDYYWALLPDYTQPQKVEKNGSYVLGFNVRAKAGYEFAEDAKVTVGGKELDFVLNYGTELEIFKVYNIGMSLIEKIELTVEEPVAGNAPEAPQLDEAAKYQELEIFWGRNSSGNVMRDIFDFDTFESGYYHFLSGVLMAEDGYAFADEVQIYVNGRKLPNTVVVNMGALCQFAVNFGKLVDLDQIQQGDLNKDGVVDEDDAIYLLRHALMGDAYPVDQDADYDKNGVVDEDDAIYLLRAASLHGNLLL